MFAAFIVQVLGTLWDSYLCNMQDSCYPFPLMGMEQIVSLFISQIIYYMKVCKSAPEKTLHLEQININSADTLRSFSA